MNNPKKKRSQKEIQITELEINSLSKGIETYLEPFQNRWLHELQSERVCMMLISFVGGILLAFGHLISGLFFTLLPIYLNRRLQEKQKHKNIDNYIKAINKDSELKNLFLTLMNSPQATHTFDDKFEKAEWINDIVKRIWPYFNGTVQNEIDRMGYTSRKENSEGMDIGGGHIVYFERFTLGDKPPVVTHIGINKAATRVNEELVIELKVLYFGNCLLSLTKKTLGCLTIKGGIKDVYFRGNARIVLRPQMNEHPYFGGMSFCLLERPIIDYEGINLANLVDNKLFKNFLVSQIESILVAPNKLYFSFRDDPEIQRQLKFAPPIGLCYFQIIEAENLPRQVVLGISTVDPFCVIRVGSTEFQTPIVFSSLNPYWGESHSAPIHDYFDQFKIDIYDKEAITADDLIGSVEFQLKDITSEKQAHGRDKWVPIGKCMSGAIHFQVTCFHLKSDPSMIPSVIQMIRESKHKFPVGLFSVYIYDLRIPSKTGTNGVVPVIQLKFGGQSFQTQPVEANKPNDETLEFKVEESHHFICNNPDQDMLEVTVLNSPGTNFTKLTRVDILWDHIIGTCGVHMSDIIQDEQKSMVLQKTCDLLKGKDTGDVKGTIKLYLCFQIVDIDKTVYDNLQAPYDIKCSINQATSETAFFRRVLMQPAESMRHPIKTIQSLRHTTIPFISQKPVAVVDDLSPAPPNIKGDCHLKIRVKWPERTYLIFEVLRVINIPVIYSDPKYQFSVVIKLGRAAVEIGRNYTKGRLISTARFVSMRTHKYFYPSEDQQREVGSVIFNERLKFKVDPTVSIEKYEVHIILMVHKRSNIICTASNEVASKITKIPPISFRNDPIEEWYKLVGFDAKGEEHKSKRDSDLQYKKQERKSTKDGLSSKRRKKHKNKMLE